MKLNSNLFRRLSTPDDDKKLFYHLRHTSLPAGTMTEKISAVAENYGMKAFVDGDKESIYMSRRTNSGAVNVCSLDFYGNILENGTFRGQKSHGNATYEPFAENQQIKELRKAIAALLGDNALTKISLSGDTDLLKTILANRNVVEIMEFTAELKAFSEAQNDWDVRSKANEIIKTAYELIEERNKPAAVTGEVDELWDMY